MVSTVVTRPGTIGPPKLTGPPARNYGIKSVKASKIIRVFCVDMTFIFGQQLIVSGVGKPRLGQL